MDDFQNIGFTLQLVALITLLLKIICTADCTGISGKTQILFALVFTTRFLDLPYELRISLISFVIKIIYLFVIYLTVVCIVIIFKKTYRRDYDKFRFEMLIGLAGVLALLTSYKNPTPACVLWHLSIFLESFAILPQIQHTARSGYVGSSLLFYVGLLASHRAFCVVQWAYLLLARGGLDEPLLAAAGTGQFLLYCGYFCWMWPRFKAQYASLKPPEDGQPVVLQPDVLTIVQANGATDEPKKLEPLIDRLPDL